MASIFLSDGSWVVSVYKCGKLRVGKDKSLAHEIHRHIEVLEKSVKHGVDPSPATQAWVRSCNERIRKWLVDKKLATGSHARTVGDLEDYFAQSKSPKRQTQLLHDSSVWNMVTFFSREMVLSDIHKPDAVRFKKWMLDHGRKKKSKEFGTKLAPPTVSRRFKHIRGMFESAVEMNWIGKNPFNGIKAGKQANPGRKQYVTPEIAQQILDDLPTVELRLIFALLRWAGMRMPTEPKELKWSDIDWNRRSMTFKDTKNSHIPGREYRTCPIFGELYPYLRDAWEVSKGVYVCPSLRRSNARQWFEHRLEASLKRLDIPKWPVVFNSLRASRATEVRVRHGVDDEAKWIGHGADVSMLHYVLNDADIDNSWARAVAGISPEEGENSKTETCKTEN